MFSTVEVRLVKESDSEAKDAEDEGSFYLSTKYHSRQIRCSRQSAGLEFEA